MIAIGRELLACGNDVIFFANPVYALETGISVGNPPGNLPVNSVEDYSALLGDFVEEQPDKALKRVTEGALSFWCNARRCSRLSGQTGICCGAINYR